MFEEPQASTQAFRKTPLFHLGANYLLEEYVGCFTETHFIWYQDVGFRNWGFLSQQKILEIMRMGGQLPLALVPSSADMFLPWPDSANVHPFSMIFWVSGSTKYWIAVACFMLHINFARQPVPRCQDAGQWEAVVIPRMPCISASAYLYKCSLPRWKIEKKCGCLAPFLGGQEMLKGIPLNSCSDGMKSRRVPK